MTDFFLVVLDFGFRIRGVNDAIQVWVWANSTQPLAFWVEFELTRAHSSQDLIERWTSRVLTE